MNSRSAKTGDIKTSDVWPWATLVVSLGIAIVFGIAPIATWVSHHWPGVPTQQATVTKDDPTTRGRHIVSVTAPDGSDQAFVYSGHLFYPSKGDRISVYEKGGTWHARDEEGLPWSAPLWLALGVGGTVMWFVLRRRRRQQRHGTGKTARHEP